MPWPTDQEYNEAIQNPRTAFADSELQVGVVETNAMGLPKARSGNFATVYKVTVNGVAHAVRCFRHDNPEHSTRYPAIASYLTQNSMPYMVPFRYMSQGVRVGSSWYPFVRMRWVEGDSLVSYIEKNLSSPATLRDLAKAWVQMVTDLQRANIAHGDLQHGNVLVVQGKLRLVDYDGMYVPALGGGYSIELGHRNYQHPQRTELDFGPYLDNFSSWLIYASLVATAAQPTLWGQLKAGDECLLFRKADLDAPERSAAFRLLRSSPDAQARTLADQIEHFLWLPPDQVPVLAEQETGAAPLGRSAPAAEPASTWIQDYTKQFADEAAFAFPVIEAGDPGWIRDHVEFKPDIDSFASSVWADRYIVLSAFVSAFLICAWLSFGSGIFLAVSIWIGGAAVASLVSIASLRIRYRLEPVFLTIRAAGSDLGRVTEERDAAQRNLEEIKAKRLRRRATFTGDGLSLQSRQAALQADETKRLNDIEAALQTALQQINNRRRTAISDEGTEKRRLAETVGAEVSRLSHALSALPDQERQEVTRVDSGVGAKVSSLGYQIQDTVARRDRELAAVLKEYQDQVVNGHLQKVRLSDASLPGIGPQLKQRLAVAGFVSAGDIGTRYENVPGIGAIKWAVLHDWRRQLEGPIRTREAPKSLPLHRSSAIEQRFEAQIVPLQRSFAREQLNLVAAQQAIKTRFADQKRTLEQQKASSETNLRQQTAMIDKKFNDQRKLIAADEQVTRARTQQASEDCWSQCRVVADQLQQEGDRIKQDYKTSLDQLNKEIESTAKQVREVAWRQDQMARRYSAYGFLRFREYLLRLTRKVVR